MKKVSLLTALLLSAGMASTASADVLTGGCPQAFKGFHVGGILGYGVATISANGARAGLRGIEGGIGTGYTFACGNWRYGLAFDAIWASTKGNGFRLKNSLELYGKLGYVICDKVMPFLGLGWANAKWSGNAGGESGSSRVNSLLWKAGVDFLMTKHVVMGMEYVGAYGKKHDVKFQPNRFAATVRFVY